MEWGFYSKFIIWAKPWILLLSFGQEKDKKNDVENGKLKEEENMAQSDPKQESE